MCVGGKILIWNTCVDFAMSGRLADTVVRVKVKYAAGVLYKLVWFGEIATVTIIVD